MENLNKFKILTIVLICMFVFVVAAIYSNTKDATTSRMLTKTEIEQKQQEVNNSNTNTVAPTGNVQDLTAQLEFLNKRVDELSEKVNNPSNSSIGLNCKLIGSMTENGIEQLSEDAIIQEAKDNNRDMVISCSFQ